MATRNQPELWEQAQWKAEQRTALEFRIRDHAKKNPERCAKEISRYFGVSHSYVDALLRNKAT